MSQQGFDYNKLRREAQMRWLKPAEILYILQNHERYPITPEAPQNPPSGSLFLFNRRVLRYFRKDGHNWRKKKDGRNVGEAHERLKVGNIEALNCYYAHGGQNPYFQRRSYWMLDPAYEHIVLVHYREVSEGRFLSGSISNTSGDSCSTFNQSTCASNAHHRGIVSGPSEQYDPTGCACSPATVEEGRFLSGSISNMSGDSCSTFNQSTSANNAHHHGIVSGTSEQYDPTGCVCSPATVEEVSSKVALGKYTIDGLRNSDMSPQPEVSLALHKLAMQLSLEDDDGNTIYFGEKFPAFSSEYEKSQDFGFLDQKTMESLPEVNENPFCGMEYWRDNQVEPGKQDGYGSTQPLKVSGDDGKQGRQSLGSGDNIETPQTWNNMLEFSSDFAPINTHERTSNLVSAGILEPSLYANGRTSNLPAQAGTVESSICRPSAHDQASCSPFEKSEQFSLPQLDHRGNNVENRLARHHIPGGDLSLQLSATREFLLGPEDLIGSSTSISQLSKIQMQNSCGTTTCETSSDVAKFRKQTCADWMAAVDLDVQNNTYSSDFSTMWLDQGQLGIPLRDDSSLTVAEKQRFRIHEISPEWAFCYEATKVIVIGDFLCNYSECPWAIMFGDIQVPAEIVQEGVLRCITPQIGDGKVSLCVTSGNRESCSEVREFEFCAKPTASSFTVTPSKADVMRNSEELLLLIKLVHMLLCSSDGLSTFNSRMGTESMSEAEARWSQITDVLLIGSEVPSDALYWIFQELLKDKLQWWLSSKQNKDCLLSKQEQGIIHMISGLGYGWALNPLLDSGVGVNFRDSNGWTALHWAARFGREEMVAALLAAGASAGAVTDPTPLDPVGKTAGAIAAANGHTGLAGYLSEADLTSHLSSLTIGKNELSQGSAELEAERAVESISQRSVQMHVGGTEDELSLKDSLAAVRNATQAAARIQSAFRAHSFRKRQQLAATSQDEYGMTLEDMHGLSASLKFQRAAHGSRDQKFDKAALSIQKKYRGWKERKDFLTLRQHVVKIQAHVRGYQERKKYKVFVWTVSVLEKVVLRWRRKGVGLRGYRAEPEPIDEEDEEVEDIVKVFRKQKVDVPVEQAVSRVISMVESPTSRQQYRRMLERYHQAKASELSTSDEATSTLNDDFVITENNAVMY